MRFPLMVFCLVISGRLLNAQQKNLQTRNELETYQELNFSIKDSIPLEEKSVTGKKIDSLGSSFSKKKRFIPYFKSMNEVTVKDYKLMFLDGSEKTVDTSLSLEREYSFNFLRKDYFEILTFPNMGEAFNKLGYNFHDQVLTPQMGARVKHFSYFEKEDVPYYEVPSAYTELFFKSTFQQGQFLDTSLAINTSPKFNVAVSFRGFRSLGKYLASLSRSRQFRISTQYQTFNERYRLRLHQTTQSLENEVNGGLNRDSVYFFENAPNYVLADENGQAILDENGNQQIVFYDGFLDRNRLDTQINADNLLEGKRYFMEHKYQMIPVSKDSAAYKMSIGYSLSYEKKKYKYEHSFANLYFYGKYDNNIIDSTSFDNIENKLFLQINNKSLGELDLNLYHIKWDYDLGQDDYEKDTLLSNSINAHQLAAQLKWQKDIFGTSFRIMAYQSMKKKYATRSIKVETEKNISDKTNIIATYNYRSQPLNFNFYLLQSDFKKYNWENSDLSNQDFSTLSFALNHKKIGSLQGEWNSIKNFTFFNNTTPEFDLNRKFSTEVFQLSNRLDYFKVRMDQRFDFGKFTLANNIQFQKVNQEGNPQGTIDDPIALNVPKWLLRSTFMLTSSIFNKALFFQSGLTFVYFTDYFADQYNPLLAEFVTQNSTTIGNYPRFDFFFNAKIQSSRVFIKLENISAPIKHLINIDAPYNYYSSPFVPYRDFSVRFGLIWNFFD
ncbi:hypothetical protein DEJ39_04185 [Bacteroidetes bacterium SCGC AAA795-G10]|nr:hypothetical protein DEJ39_04185 [Bacteroidetes bacterium SCGC AAA795-G10]